jgi:hypothetical protein
MEFSLSCATYARFAKVAKTILNYEIFAHMCSVRIEIRENYMFLFTSNSRIAVAEMIGRYEHEDCVFHIVVTDKLIEQCETEMSFNGEILFVYNEPLNFMSLKTSFGFEHGGNGLIEIQGENKFNNWRSIFPKEQPTETNASIYANLDNLASLAACSPTGMIGFQKFIDKTKPVVVRDLHSPNWVGAFLPTTDNDVFTFPIKTPDWVRS